MAASKKPKLPEAVAGKWDQMQQLTGTIPVACEYSLSDRWYKQAEAVFSDQGKLQLWSNHET